MVAIVYYSRRHENQVGGALVDLKTGITEHMVSMLADRINAPVYAIKPDIPYPKTFDDTVVRANNEQVTGKYPAITTPGYDNKKYSTLILAYPIWLDSMANPMVSFLKAHDLSNKTLIPFTTSEANPWGDSITLLQKYAPQATLEMGLWLRDITVQDESCSQRLDEWVAAHQDLVKKG